MKNRTLAEINRLSGLAWPIAIGMIAQYAMGTTDSLMAAQVSASDLAAIALGFSIWAPLLETLSGIVMAVTPLSASYVGARKYLHVATVTNHGLIIAIVLSVIAVWLLNHTTPLFSILGTAPELVAKTQAYLQAISWGVPATLLYQAVRSCSEGFGFTRPAMIIAVSAMLLNIPFNYILVFGKLGLPPLGSVGCGYASAAVMWLMLVSSYPIILCHHRLRTTRHYLLRLRPNRHLLLRILKIGIPIGCAIFIESSMFALVALLLSKDGAVVVAAHQITLNVTILIYMIPLSIGIALTIRIGHLLGAGHVEQTPFVMRCGLTLALAIATFNLVILLLIRHWIAGLYTTDTRIIDLASTLLAIAAAFHLTDSIQVACAGALRGFHDTRGPLGVAFIAYWVIGLPSGQWLARGLELGAVGYWYGLMIGLSCGAILMSRRLYRTSHAATTALPSGSSPSRRL